MPAYQRSQQVVRRDFKKRASRTGLAQADAQDRRAVRRFGQLSGPDLHIAQCSAARAGLLGGAGGGQGAAGPAVARGANRRPAALVESGEPPPPPKKSQPQTSDTSVGRIWGRLARSRGREAHSLLCSMFCRAGSTASATMGCWPARCARSAFDWRMNCSGRGHRASPTFRRSRGPKL